MRTCISWSSWSTRGPGFLPTCSRRFGISGCRATLVPRSVPEGGAAERRLAYRGRGGRLRVLHLRRCGCVRRRAGLVQPDPRATARRPEPRGAGIPPGHRSCGLRIRSRLGRGGVRARPPDGPHAQSGHLLGGPSAAAGAWRRAQSVLHRLRRRQRLRRRVPEHVDGDVRPVALRVPLVPRDRARPALPCAPRLRARRPRSRQPRAASGSQLPGCPLCDRRVPAGAAARGAWRRRVAPVA